MISATPFFMFFKSFLICQLNLFNYLWRVFISSSRLFLASRCRLYPRFILPFFLPLLILLILFHISQEVFVGF